MATEETNYPEELDKIAKQVKELLIMHNNFVLTHRKLKEKKEFQLAHTYAEIVVVPMRRTVQGLLTAIKVFSTQTVKCLDTFNKIVEKDLELRKNKEQQKEI